MRVEQPSALPRAGRRSFVLLLLSGLPSHTDVHCWSHRCAVHVHVDAGKGIGRFDELAQLRSGEVSGGRPLNPNQ